MLLLANELGRFLSDLLDFREFYVDKPMKVSYRSYNRLPRPSLGRANTGIKISDLKRQGLRLAFFLEKIGALCQSIGKHPRPTMPPPPK
jgi:hypothetical protein